MSRAFGWRAIRAVGIALVMGCHDGGLPTDASGPDAVVVGASRADALTSVFVLQRSRPLDRAVTVSARIGRDGGTIELMNGTVRLTIPSRALRATTAINVSTIGGSDVVLDFQPRGLRFDHPLTVDVSLAGTRAATDSRVQAALYAAYDREASVGVPGSGATNVSETLRVMSLRPGAARFEITQFARYTLATGRPDR